MIYSPRHPFSTVNTSQRPTLLGLVSKAKFSYGCRNCRVTVSNYQNNSASWEGRLNLISAVNRLSGASRYRIHNSMPLKWRMVAFKVLKANSFYEPLKISVDGLRNSMPLFGSLQLKS